MRYRDLRLVGLTGIVSFTLIAIASFVAPPLWDSPETNATAAEVADYAFPQRGRILAAFFIFSIAMGFFLWFSAGLWSWFQRTQPEQGPTTAAFAFGSVTMATMIFAGFAPGVLAVYRPPAPETAGLLFDLTFAVLALSGIPTTVCLGAFGALVLRGAALPRWTAWLAIVGAAAHVIIAASFFPRSGFFSLKGDVVVWVPATLFAWILGTSVALLRSPPEKTP